MALALLLCHPVAQAHVRQWRNSKISFQHKAGGLPKASCSALLFGLAALAHGATTAAYVAQAVQDCLPNNLHGQDDTHCFYSMIGHSREALTCTKTISAVLSSAFASTARDKSLYLEASQDCPQTAVAMWDAGSPVDQLGQPGQQQLGGRRAMAHDAVQGTPPLRQVVL